MAAARPLFLMAAILALALCQAGTVYAAAAAIPATIIFGRDCKDCSAVEAPTCNCAAGETCTMIPQSCVECAQVSCDSNTSAGSGGGSSNSVGAIVGGTVGGLAVVALVCFVLWKKYGRHSRERASMAATAAEKENDFGMLKNQRASTHTVASIASTVRTRASNVIQIAYIPGVTNRSTPSSPSQPIPPVPPLPLVNSPVGSQFPRSPTGDIQFAADDLLRGSMITVDRSSVATTIYGHNAVVSQPNIVRAGKANVVQVKHGSSIATSSASSPSMESSPPIPPLFTAINKAKNADRRSLLDTVPPSPAFSVGSTFLNRMNSTKDPETPHIARARVVPVRSRVAAENQSTLSFNTDDDSEDDITPGQRSKKVQSQCSSCVTDMDTGSPFSDSNSIDDLPSPAGSGLPPIGHNKQALAKRQSQRIRSIVGEKNERTVSPFDDSHSVDKAGT